MLRNLGRIARSMNSANRQTIEMANACSAPLLSKIVVSPGGFQGLLEWGSMGLTRSPHTPSRRQSYDTGSQFVRTGSFAHFSSRFRDFGKAVRRRGDGGPRPGRGAPTLRVRDAPPSRELREVAVPRGRPGLTWRGRPGQASRAIHPMAPPSPPAAPCLEFPIMSPKPAAPPTARPGGRCATHDYATRRGQLAQWTVFQAVKRGRHIKLTFPGSPRPPARPHTAGSSRQSPRPRAPAAPPAARSPASGRPGRIRHRDAQCDGYDRPVAAWEADLAPFQRSLRRLPIGSLQLRVTSAHAH